MTKDKELEQLRQENRVLREQVAQLSERISVLEAQLAKDSHNSHLPPSSDRFQRQPKSLRKKSGKQPGGQAGHVGKTLKLSETPDQVIVHAVDHCQHCQQDLRAVASLYVERRQVIDLPAKRVQVIEHQAQQKCCPACQQISLAAFPEDVRAPVQYGAAIGAVGVYLVQQQLLPYERACEVIEDLLGASMSVGTLQALIARCAAQLAPVEQQIKAALSRAEVLHQDETGLYVAGQRQWMHVHATEHLTHYAVHPQRGKAALDAIGILADFQGVSVHDGWQSYWRFLCQHALCNVHHLRELTFLDEEQGQAWAAEMKALLLEMKTAVAQARAEGRRCLHPLEVADWKARYAALLAEGYQANPPDPPPETAKKGRRKQSPARNLLDRLSTHQEAVLLFLDNFAVPFDNSLAERAIRMVKVQQKVSGCFRSPAGAVAFCRIRGYLSTLRKQGLAVLTALEQALVGHPVSPAF
jgi:transposase